MPAIVKVEDAYSWVCPHCKHRNFDLLIGMEMNKEEMDEMRLHHPEAFIDGDPPAGVIFSCYPEEVACDTCHTTSLTEVHQVPENES